jgi:hypothetical protein
VLGLWIEHTEGAKFWLKVFNDLKTRGCLDILVAVVDGLKGIVGGYCGGLSANQCSDLHRSPNSQ